MNIERKTNHLINEKSPYLLQHAYNPINWYPWCEEAFNKAKEEEKPIFLSIGYSTCHWCHVMEKESFEDEEVARLMNENFISIKVDREERPDVDSVYMTVCQNLTGHGGWPLTIIMTPEQKPFYAGTYFPKRSRYNMPGLMDVLNTVITEWDNNREKVLNIGNEISEHLDKYYAHDGENKALSKEILKSALNQFKLNFDKKYGGFGKAPKFPTPHKIMYLIKDYKLTGDNETLEIVEKTLDSMYVGGLFDHVGFGFSRYSTDSKWLVPHFEKMLYDNALLIIAYLEGYEVTGKELYKNIAVKSLEYVFRELTSKEGSFYSAEDADSEGEEGKFYVFNPVEIVDLLGEEDGNYFNEYFDITPSGNFEGKNIPNLINNSEYRSSNHRIDELIKKVLEYRNIRMHLHKDDKILTSWNGLIIAALGKAYKVLGDAKYLIYGNKAVDFIFENLVGEDGRLLARYRDGEANFKAYLDDYAFLVWGLLELYESSFDIKYLEKAIDLNNKMIKLFWDNKEYGFYLYGEDGEQLIARPKELYDGAIPSGNSVAAYNLIRLAKITGESRLEELASKQISFIANRLYGGEINYSFYLMALSFALNQSRELICVLKDEVDLGELKKILKEVNTFNLTILVKSSQNEREINKLAPFIKEYKLNNNETTYYLCKGNSCLPPFNDINKLKEILEK